MAVLCIYDMHEYFMKELLLNSLIYTYRFKIIEKYIFGLLRHLNSTIYYCTVITDSTILEVITIGLQSHLDKILSPNPLLRGRFNPAGK